MRTTTVKLSFLALMLGLTAYQCHSLYREYQRKQQLEQALAAALEQEEAERKAQQQQYELAMAAWREQQRIRSQAVKEKMVVEGNSNNNKVTQIPDKLAPPPPQPTVIEASLSKGIRVELQNDTSWQTILQLVFTVLATYLGLKLINRYVGKTEAV